MWRFRPRRAAFRRAKRFAESSGRSFPGEPIDLPSLADLFSHAHARFALRLRRFHERRLVVDPATLPQHYALWFSMPWRRGYTRNVDDPGGRGRTSLFSLPRRVRAISAPGSTEHRSGSTSNTASAIHTPTGRACARCWSRRARRAGEVRCSKTSRSTGCRFDRGVRADCPCSARRQEIPTQLCRAFAATERSPPAFAQGVTVTPTKEESDEEIFVVHDRDGLDRRGAGVRASGRRKRRCGRIDGRRHLDGRQLIVRQQHGQRIVGNHRFIRRLDEFRVLDELAEHVDDTGESQRFELDG